MYAYRITSARAIDGDTVDAAVDLGFGVSINVRLRLMGIDAPEKRRLTLERGRDSQKYLQMLLDTRGPLLVRTHKPVSSQTEAKEKYGRYLADIYGAEGESLNRKMVLDGYAEEYEP